MSEMVERVAMAIAGYMHPDNVEKYWFNWIEEVDRLHYRAQARAAIEAMRELPDSMLKAEEDWVGDGRPWEIWRNLIGDILK
jgi:hypothetical protein